jgi:hypothetical protein
MLPQIVSVGPIAAASANNICLSQTPPAGALTLNGAAVSGGVAVLDALRQLSFASSGNNSNTTFTINGTDWAGMPISEQLVGANVGTVVSKLGYKTVTSITSSASSPAGLTVGTNGVAFSPWVRFDYWDSAPTAIQAVVTGAVNYSIQQTLDDPNNPQTPVAPAAMTWFNSSDANVVNSAVSMQSNYLFTPIYARVMLNSGAGSVKATFMQSDSGNY